jgi:hypothetical protein
MAAYLGYAKTKSLTKLQDRFFEDWTNRKSRESVIATLKAEIGKGFDNPSANTFSSRINETRFFQYAGVVNRCVLVHYRQLHVQVPYRQLHVQVPYRQLRRTQLTQPCSIPDDVLAAGLPVDRKLYSATEKHSVLPTVSYVVAAYQLSRTFPEWMVSYSDTGRLSESTETLANIHPENWHRLFQAIRFFLSLLGSDITQRKDTIDNPEARKVVRKPQNKPAMRLQYLDKEEMIGVSRKKAAASNVQADAALQVTQVQELLRSSLLSEQNTGQKKKTREEIEEGINEFGEALNITGEKVVGNRAGMPPLTSEAQEKLLDIIFQRTVKNKQMYYRRRFEWSSHSRQLSRV